MTETPAYAVEATGTSLAILETLVDAEEPLGVTGLSEQVGVAKSVAHNHLSTLRAHGYVLKRDGRYEPTLRTLSLGNHTRAEIDVYDEAKPKVDNLADATGETTMLFVLEEDQGVPAYVTGNPDGWSPTFREGERMPLHINAPGKSMLASLPEERADAILDGGDLAAPTDKTITETATLRSQLARIRDDGISFCKEEQYSGIVGVAAPIPTTTGSRTAAIGVCGPAERLSGRYLEEDVTGQVLRTTKSVQVALTGD